MDTCICVCIHSCSVISDPWWPINCSTPGSSVKGIFQTRILEWVAIPLSRRYSGPRDQTLVSCIAGRNIYIYTHTHHSLPTELPWKPPYTHTHTYIHVHTFVQIHRLYNTKSDSECKLLDIGWSWYVNIGPSIVTTVPLWWGILIMGEAMHMWRQGVYGEPLYLPLNFAVNFAGIYPRNAILI